MSTPLAIASILLNQRQVAGKLCGGPGRDMRDTAEVRILVVFGL